MYYEGGVGVRPGSKSGRGLVLLVFTTSGGGGQADKWVAGTEGGWGVSPRPLMNGGLPPHPPSGLLPSPSQWRDPAPAPGGCLRTQRMSLSHHL